VRCFVAIELTAELRNVVARLQAAVREAAGSVDVRWTDRDGWHLTVKFLGQVRDDAVPAVSEALARVAAGSAPMSLATGALGAFPSPRRARVVWLGLSAGADDVARLAAATDAALAPLGFAPEARPYHAHVTLGRVRAPTGLHRLARALDEVSPGAPASWTAEAVVLFQSHTRPTGAVYTPVARLPWGPRT
jgi:RNA 2',3'-cyclic 3'-phosphodiesterase